MNDNSLLLRQIHKSFIKTDGYVMEEAFKPRERDNGRLSLYDSDIMNPKESFDHYNNLRNCVSSGVMAFSVGEVSSVDLQAFSSPSENNPAHAHIDLSYLSENDKDIKVRLLGIFANNRKRVYPLASWD